ncbi:MAG: DUF547 domain-containing protein [Bdellovibrionales bacterium]|nr:DUF547 domain-containing protein [Bdellovibrionales bacterium]
MKILFMFTMTIFSLNAMSADPMPKDPIKLPNKYKIMEKNEVVKDTTLVSKKHQLKPISVFDHQHTNWQQILAKYVIKKEFSSQFKYKELKQDTSLLDKYLNELSHVSLKEFNSWSQNQQMAFLINAYNAFTVKLIIDNYPVKSIKKIGGFFTSPWKKEFFTLLEDKRNLDWIEHEELRKKYSEPRIHFAVNCASIGCPALRNEAFNAENLDKQLEEQTRIFLLDSSRNYIKGDTLNVSKIFDWFEEDFEKNGQSVQSFVAQYITQNTMLQNKLKNKQFKVRYTSYDWNLNEAR